MGLVSGQNFTLEDLNPTFGVNLNGAPSLSTTSARHHNGHYARPHAQTQTATINLAPTTPSQ